MRVKLLGGFLVSVGPRTIGQDEWRLKKAASLVKLLAINSGHRLHREQVMDVLWPDSSRKASSNNLRQVLHCARRVFGHASDSLDSYLGLRDEHLILCPEGHLWLDVDAFEEATARARRSRDPGAYRAALELYAGELLPEDRYEEWTEGRRAELRQLYLGLLIELARLHERREEHVLAIETLRKATVAEPTLEEAHASIMRLHALSGRPERALAQYERLRDALQKGIGTRPTEATRRLREEISAGRLPPALPVDTTQDGSPAAIKHNLPAPMTSFVGREEEMVEVKRTLAMTRLLTLTGAGGTGKTRLALEAARELIGSFPDGVWFVELAPLAEPGLVTQEVAATLGGQERPGEPLTDTLVKTVATKEMLLVLDNCEHLVEEAAWLVDKLLASCQHLKVLATSRESLGVSGEVVWAVSPLSLPKASDGGRTTETLIRYEAVNLFLDRARLRLPDFGLTKANAQAVAGVCRKLDGIPLAIELATARMGVLAVEQVAQRLDMSLDVLKGNGRSVTPRQRTLRATLDWSHDLLSREERTFFGRLSVFSGGWTLESAEMACSGDGIDQDGVLDLLGGLVDKSLVVARANTVGAIRYRMLEPVRQYARERLEKSGRGEVVRDRHAEFCLALAEEAEPELGGPNQSLWVERLEAEHDNMREALSWALEQDRPELGLRLGGALWAFWQIRDYLSEGIRWLDQTLAGSESASSERVKALEGMGRLTQRQGDTEWSEAAYGEMLELSRELDSKGDVATALNSLGTLALARGDNKRARALLEENLAVLRQLEEDGDAATPLKRFHTLNLLAVLTINEKGDYRRATVLLQESLVLAKKAEDTERALQALCNLGYTALMQGDYERVRTLGEEALTSARDPEGGNTGIIPETLINSGLASLQQGHHKQASASFKEALTISQAAGIKSSSINALEGMASLAGALGKPTRAAHLWGVAEAARSATGIALPPGEEELHEPFLATARSELGEATWRVALAEGRRTSLEEAAEYVLSEQETDIPASSTLEQPLTGEPMGELTRRQQEVALLVARGCTNRQVAAELSISERTASNHVAKILGTLGLRSRVQIAAWATESNLLTPHSD